MPNTGNTKGVSITVPLTSCLTGLESDHNNISEYFSVKASPLELRCQDVCETFCDSRLEFLSVKSSSYDG